jgi:hypothetical protein
MCVNKIPVIPTIAKTYGFVLGQFGRIVGLIWLPAVLVAVSGFFLKLPYLRFMADNQGQEDLVLQHGTMLLGLYACGALEVVLYAIMTAAITREVLHPSTQNTYFNFSLNGTTFRLIGGYFGLFGMIMVFLLAVLSAVLSLRLLPGGKAADAAAGIVLLICIPIAIYLVARLSFLIAPSTVEGKGFGLVQSWRMTDGNVWRIVALAMATSVPVALVFLMGQVAIMGPDVVVKPFELAMSDPSALEKTSLHLQKVQADNFPLLAGLEFFLAPLTIGMTTAAAAFSYRALTED